ncbi:hypothetical protein H2200_000590 [Cladophialophora chaetospira]|uniref:Zn(2)-C6 fungal-type domain-containing protein n=1 Tax=Cladophialophora chaetospira TaxID=386627 RepID=A0AA39CQH3_9EURO|nr:hypothetical protein H2200_000590 [Cladophialophora chaetospira]
MDASPVALRARRKKCDETKPSCLRCEAAGKVCEGYRNAIAPSPSALESKRQLARSLPYGLAHTRCSWYGLVALTEEVTQNEFGVDAAMWAGLISKVYRISPAVHTAVSCLGATYERLSSSRLVDQVLLDSSIKELYAMSLRKLQEEIEEETNGLPLFFASVILATVEVLQDNPINALTHTQGAFRLYGAMIPASDFSLAASKTDLLQSEEQHALTSIVRSLDIQTASYALARPLDLPPFSVVQNIPTNGSTPPSTERMRSQILSLLHNCYHFAIQASKHRYVHCSHIPPDITVDQGRHISLLLSWLSVLKDCEKQGSSSADVRLDARQRCILSLRAQCLSSLVYLSAILCPHETSYDAFLDLFDEIVQIAFLMLYRDGTLAKGRSRPRFRLLSSLSQPLFLTAMKCRDPQVRRKAVELLALTGREGPWDAEILVPVVAAAIALEEGSGRQGRQVTASDLEGEDTRDLMDLSILVPPRLRLHGCGLGAISVHKANSTQQDVKRTIDVRFSRCVNVEDMVTSTEGNNSRAFEDERHWDIWHQTVEL